MDLTWKQHWFKLKTEFFDDKRNLVGVFNHFQDKQLGGYSFVDDSGGFTAQDQYYNRIDAECKRAKSLHKGHVFYHLSIAGWKGIIVVENELHCYIESDDKPVLSYYKSYHWLTFTGKLVFSEELKTWPLLVYALFYVVKQISVEGE